MAIAVCGMMDERDVGLKLIKDHIEKRGHEAIVIDFSIGTGAISPVVRGRHHLRRPLARRRHDAGAGQGWFHQATGRRDGRDGEGARDQAQRAAPRRIAPGRDCRRRHDGDVDRASRAQRTAVRAPEGARLERDRAAAVCGLLREVFQPQRHHRDAQRHRHRRHERDAADAPAQRRRRHLRDGRGL